MKERHILFIFLTFVIVYIYLNMIMPKPQQKQQPPGSPTVTDIQQEVPTTGAQPAQPLPVTKSRIPIIEAAEVTTGDTVAIASRDIEVGFNTRGGVIESLKLLHYHPSVSGEGAEIPQELVAHYPFLKNQPYPLSIELAGYADFNTVNFEITTQTEPNGFSIQLASPPVGNIQIIKEIFIPDEGYLFDVSVTIKNIGEMHESFNTDGLGFALNWGAGFNDPDWYDPKGRNSYYYTGVYYIDDDVYYDRSLKAGALNAKRYRGDITWAGLQSKYFFAAIIPESEPEMIQTISMPTPSETIDLKTYPEPIKVELWNEYFTLRSNSEKTFSYKVFTGPKETELLQELNYNLDQILFYSSWFWMRWFCFILMWFLKLFYGILRNYGLAIIAVTVVTKVVLYPLTHKGIKMQAQAMEEQTKMKPIIDAIKEKYKDNPQVQQRETMKAYKAHGISPFSAMRGCLPMLLQLPILIAFYHLLSQTIELRGQPFLWIDDLSKPDVLFYLQSIGIKELPIIGDSVHLLPLVMAASQFLTSKQTIKDPQQASMMIMMPVVFLFIMWNMPSGVVLYWLISNLWQSGHQFLVQKARKKSETSQSDKPRRS